MEYGYNYTQDSNASYDFIKHDNDPTPDYASSSEEPNSHGTECSGVVGMANNSICGIGVAHQAHIGCECTIIMYEKYHTHCEYIIL